MPVNEIRPAVLIERARISGARRTPHLRSILLATFTLVVGATACNDAGTGLNNDAAETLLADAVNSTPVGFSLTESSFADAENDSWGPRARRHAGRGGPFGSAFGTGFMGGGLSPDFATGAGFHAGVARGPFGGGFRSEDCAFEEGSGKVVCGPSEGRLGLTVERWVIWTDVDGVMQRAPNASTFSMQTHAEVSGTVPMREGATRTVRHVSDRLVEGLEEGSTQRTINGSSMGTEAVTGERAGEGFTAKRDVSDMTTGLVVPVRSDGRTYPIAGRVVRQMEVEVTMAGGRVETATWQEVLTYDGSNTATLVITRNGTEKTCSVPLPAGRPVCRD